MNDVARVVGGRSSPGLRYRNVRTAIDWLCRAYGFEVYSVETDETGAVIYAELSFGTTMIMIGAVSGFDIDPYMKQPDDIGGAETQCCYYVVEDIDTLYARARREGARIVIDLETRPNGARVFTCRDPEGHLWSFGTYDPWQNVAIDVEEAELPKRAMDMRVLAAPVAAAPARAHSMRLPVRLAAGLSMAAIVSGIVAWIYYEAWQTSREAGAAPATLIGPGRMIGAQIANEEFQRAIKDAQRRLAIERRSRIVAERASKAARAEADHERSSRISAEQTAKALAKQLEEERRAADLAQDAAKTAAANLAKVRAAQSEDHARLAHAAEEAQKAADATRAEQAHLASEANAAKMAASKARAELARSEEARAAAEAATRATRARLTFVSHNTRVSSEQAIAEIRKQMTDEKALRAAAERQAQEARDELAHERSLKLAALQTVEELKQRLAKVDDAQPTYAEKKRRVIYVKKEVTVAPQPSPSSKQVTMGTDGWSLNHGPHFVKGGEGQ